MQPAFPYRLKDQQLWLSPDRCIFWEEEKSLIVSDLHFGKTGHFRKSGIGVPQSVYREDLQRLLTQIQYFRPRQLLVVGDLFHSRENKELALFQRWREDFPDLGVRLIKGNHDILHDDWYQAAGIELSPERLQIGEFAFIHDITDDDDGKAGEEAAATYFFSGHIHPGIRINGLGKQSLRFPCFYFGEEYAVLPAFSRFTGMASIYPAPGENVFAILPPSTPGRLTEAGQGSIFQIQ
ncbi:MAG TPA: ligase-associated DNA damage response endonuclease PdeM [Puia sp.]|nr:ligase-associated DNA damage response endonuclease PdeM [Puia sp.]